MAERLEMLVMRSVIVYLTVLNNPDGPVFVGHGLATGLQVDNAQPSKPEADLPILGNEVAFCIRTSMSHAIGHRLQRRHGDRRGRRANIQNATDTTHCEWQPPGVASVTERTRSRPEPLPIDHTRRRLVRGNR